MFLTENLCYLEMTRSGSTHLVKLLNKYVPNGKIIGVHNRAKPNIYNSNRFFVGSIRNPWEWYVSAWSFGCVKKGGLHRRLTTKKVYFNNIGFKTKPLLSPYIFIQQFWKPLNRWRQLYSDPQNINNFREWLKLLLGNTRIHDTGEGYGLSSINKFAGLMTYRYLTLYSNDIRKMFNNSITNYDDLEKFDNENNILNYIVKNETLEDDFIQVLKKLNIEINETEKKMIYNEKSDKFGAWRNLNLNDFFDEECLNIIQSKEKLIINKYNYKKPTI